jgi:hypothetical protein
MKTYKEQKSLPRTLRRKCKLDQHANKIYLADETILKDAPSTENWFSRAKAEADKGVPLNERVMGVAIVVISVLVIVYFVAHQVGLTGFFTPAFGVLEMFMLYGNLTAWIITGTLEGILGQRLLSRLFDAFGGIIFITVSLAWLTVVFPFDFAYFADVLPDFLRFLVQWLSNDICSRANGDWGHSVYCCSSLFSSSVQVSEQGTL